MNIDKSKSNITPKIITANGYIKNGFTEIKKPTIKAKDQKNIRSREAGAIMRKK